MVLFPNCKINFGLSILDKRVDGYHNIETIFYPLGIKDAVEIISSSHKTKDILFSSSGLLIDASEEDNLCIKAYRLLKANYPSLPPVQIHLHKTIPFGAGLGGGSANAAFTLRLLNEKYSLNLTTQQLMDYALQLGSDCPFFIINTPALANGRGEILQPIDINLSQYKITIVNPDIHINTGWAFKQHGMMPPKKEKPISIKEIISQNIETWHTHLQNDFEAVVFAAYPIISDIKKELYHQGAVYASMSGTGSTVFGIFKKEGITQFNFPPNYFIKTILNAPSL